ncbi:ARF GTPase-activating protein GIT2a isoform X5 [Brachyhypopomus gauderio]|uniref:ARF GTPase-activating protein GIT2a isoform X5 n=1 Tax=Brachyhypopomus gauderio TaxID=698409 RepID=UPI004042D31F
MSKRIRNSEVCADCGAPDPHWASVNRAVLICDQCCSVHRSLGRHSSQVRHLTNTAWPPTQLQMVQTLYNNGANSIWEHSLLDPASGVGSRRKTLTHDKLHPNKAEFIKAKYQMLAFVHRMPCRDEDSCTARDLSKQLHSSVRSGNLETSLRLLSLGAQANFFHPEKGTTPLHVAAKAGQVCQAELLAVYGADPGALDAHGNMPIDYAREVGNVDLADRLVEIQYELTDRLAFYLCGRKPDHKNGQHFIIPQLADSQDLTELAKAAKRKLQSLSNHLFEELAMDVYDEVDRRETDAVWHTTQTHSALANAAAFVPFLPVNPEYSSTRNQGRQKLARFNAHEFATLIIDILSDARRRQLGNTCAVLKDEPMAKRLSSRHGSESQDTDQPDYDSVASDEDTDVDVPCGMANRTKSMDSDVSDGPVSAREFQEVKGALAASEAKIQQLMKANTTLSEELRVMQEKCQSLHTENSSLRHQVSIHPQYQGPGCPSVPNSPVPLPPVPLPPVVLTRRPYAWLSRPASMYETSAGLAPFLPGGESPCSEEFPSLQACPTHISKADKKTSVSDGDYDNTVNDSELDHSGGGGKRLQCTRSREEELQGPEAEPTPALPTTEEVIHKTEQITKNIQELLRAAQEDQHDRWLGGVTCSWPRPPTPPSSRPPESRQSVRRLRHSLGCFSTLMPWAEKPPSTLQALGGRSSGTASNPMGPGDPASCFISCAERIHMAVSGMVALFPQEPRSASARASLRSLAGGARRLQDECRGACPPDGAVPPTDPLLLTQQVIQCAYDIAKAAKLLVTITTKENAY